MFRIWQCSTLKDKIHLYHQFASGLKLKDIYDLFPLGPARDACRIDGRKQVDNFEKLYCFNRKNRLHL